MENNKVDSMVQMGFVMPKELASSEVPTPTGQGVAVRKRSGGRFAVIRFAGQLDAKSAKDSELKLREWMGAQGLKADDAAESSGVETAGYDPPFTPGPLRRNEVLIRLK